MKLEIEGTDEELTALSALQVSAFAYMESDDNEQDAAFDHFIRSAYELRQIASASFRLRVMESFLAIVEQRAARSKATATA